MTASRPLPLLPTTVVGSYPQPNWLVDHEKLVSACRHGYAHATSGASPSPSWKKLRTTRRWVAIRDLERVGIDIPTDGEMRRESYSNRFATALDGVDIDSPGQTLSRSGRPDIVPRIVGPIRRRHPVEVRDVEFLRANTDRTIKITVPGPFTMSQQAVDEFYGDEARLAMDYAAAVNDEIRDLVAAGADVIQIDEPYVQARVEKARRFAVEAINRALDGVRATTVLHTCFGYGLIIKEKSADEYPFLEELCETRRRSDLDRSGPAQPRPDRARPHGRQDDRAWRASTSAAKPIETVDGRRRPHPSRPEHLPPERLIIAPDCGMKYLSRQAAFAKLRVMVDAAHLVRDELVGQGAGHALTASSSRWSTSSPSMASAWRAPFASPSQPPRHDSPSTRHPAPRRRRQLLQPVLLRADVRGVPGTGLRRPAGQQSRPRPRIQQPGRTAGRRLRDVDDCRHDWTAWLDFAEPRGFGRIGRLGPEPRRRQDDLLPGRPGRRTDRAGDRDLAAALLPQRLPGPRGQRRLPAHYYERAQRLVDEGAARTALFAADLPTTLVATARIYLDKYGPRSGTTSSSTCRTSSTPLLVTIGGEEGIYPDRRTASGSAAWPSGSLPWPVTSRTSLRADPPAPTTPTPTAPTSSGPPSSAGSSRGPDIEVPGIGPSARG